MSHFALHVGHSSSDTSSPWFVLVSLTAFADVGHRRAVVLELRLVSGALLWAGYSLLLSLATSISVEGVEARPVLLCSQVHKIVFQAGLALGLATLT